MSHGHFIRAIREWGIVGTFKKVYKMRTIKFGNLVGTDQFGNEYYENTKDYQHGQHRWCEYAGDRSFYQVEPTVVPPEWHLWLHQITDEVPTSTTTGSTHRTPPQENSRGSSAPYARNLGGVVSQYTPNLSQYRPRGFGLSNCVFPDSKPNEELYYTQPGWPMDPRNKQRWTGRAKHFSLRDTPLTLRAKEAARAGLSISDYERFRDNSPTNAALFLQAANTNSADKELPEELALADLPKDPRERAVATRVALRTGHARSWNGGLDRGSFQGAVADALSPEEAAALKGPSESSLVEKIQQHEEIVAKYVGIRNRQAESGVERAREVIADAQAALVTLRAANAKVAAISAEFDKRGFEMAAAAESQAIVAESLSHVKSAD